MEVEADILGAWESAVLFFPLVIASELFIYITHHTELLSTPPGHCFTHERLRHEEGSTVCRVGSFCLTLWVLRIELRFPGMDGEPRSLLSM